MLRFLQQQGESAAPMRESCAARLVQPQSWLPRDVLAASQPLYVQAELGALAICLRSPFCFKCSNFNLIPKD